MDEPLSYKELLQAYEHQIEKYNSLIDTSPDGIMFLTAVRNENHRIVDFIISHCNRAGTILGHIPSDAISQTLLTVLPHLKNSKQFEQHKQVVETGYPIQFETSFRNENGQEYGWFIVSLMKIGDGVFSRFIDITQKKENEHKRKLETEFYNGILEASINGVFACRAIRNKDNQVVDFTIIKVNKAFRELTAMSASQVEGQSLLTLFPDSVEAGLFDMYCQVLETGVPIRREMKATTRSGNWYDISIGKINHNDLAITFTNITERINAFEEVKNQRNLLYNIMKYSPSGITVTEMIRDENNKVIDARLIIANDITQSYTGISTEEALKKRISELDPNFINSGLLEKAEETLLTGKPFRIQYFYEPHNSWLELGVSKMDDNRLVNIYTDITESKNSQLQLEKLVEELKRSNSSLEDFTYAASHDLKEPIRKIRIFADRLKENHTKNINEEGIKILDRLIASSTRMRLLVDDLLEYSHINLFEKEPEHIDLNAIILKVIDDLELEIDQKKAKIKIDSLPTITGQSRQLQQVFQNLISNAIKYSKEEIPPIIHITHKEVYGIDIGNFTKSADADKIFHHLKIEDNGIGFDESQAERIFKIFQRLHDRDIYEGTGLGLFIVKKVIEKHEGYISVNSKPGVGSVFNIYLPK